MESKSIAALEEAREWLTNSDEIVICSNFGFTDKREIYAPQGMWLHSMRVYGDPWQIDMEDLVNGKT